VKVSRFQHHLNYTGGEGVKECNRVSNPKEKSGGGLPVPTDSLNLDKDSEWIGKGKPSRNDCEPTTQMDGRVVGASNDEANNRL
jgi:hypothetical protein